MNLSFYLLDSAHITDVLKDLKHGAKRKNAKPKKWCCAVCKAYVTDDDCKVDINGSHEHYKLNPQGHAFLFRSFKQAEGCMPVGQATAEYTWFSGYLWQFSYCVTCHTQLGWYFTGSESFFGLIADHIVPCEQG